ncbi:MAG: camphor resistance protein CrcB [Solirubrobacterales bacterium]|jgi:CrcB protein|nr:camphor resistance protein CrcB [Solirubrobacterales bacterium]
MTVLVWIAVGVVGGLGALARFLLDSAVSERAPGAFPFGTLVVNVSGAALLGLVVGLALHGDALLVAGTGALGSYTTFSTWMFETHRLGEDGELWTAALNVTVTLAVGLGAVALGRALG